MTEADLLAELEAQLAQRRSHKVGVAVSGGSDSMALLALMARLAERIEIEPVAISVDHQLRTGAGAELRTVTELCGQLGLAHEIEIWRGWDGTGNLQAAARDARYELIADWAHGNGITTVALGHTANDQAETTLMRLARGAGVDGLSGMAALRIDRGIAWARPLLGITRETLRGYLRDRGIVWSDDPSNENTDFERVRVRRALEVLEPLGITALGLSRTARHMRKAREALNWHAFLSAREVATVRLGAVGFDMRRFRTLPDEVARRLLVRGIMWVASLGYPPRGASVERAMEAVRNGGAATLEGVQIQRAGDVMWLFREYAAVEDAASEVGDIWDERWYVDGPEDDPEIEVRAMGAGGLSQAPHWRETGLPRAALMSVPGVFMGDELIAAPALGDHEDWTAEVEGGVDGFFGALISH